MHSARVQTGRLSLHQITTLMGEALVDSCDVKLIEKCGSQATVHPMVQPITV
jgi:hypothetical protein